MKTYLFGILYVACVTFSILGLVVGLMTRTPLLYSSSITIGILTLIKKNYFK